MKLNEAALKPEYIFMTYDDVIRTSMVSFIDRLISLRSDYEDYIDFSKIVDKKPYEIFNFLLTRISYNPLIHLSKREFQYDATYISLTTDMNDRYKYSPHMVMTSVLKQVNEFTKFNKTFYIYHPYKDKYIEDDIASIVNGNMSNIKFVYGKFTEVVNSIEENITLYVVNDLLLADDIITNAKNQCADILVANYGYNYTLTEIEGKNVPILKIPNIDEKAISKNFRLRMYMPYSRDMLEAPHNIEK